MRTDIHRNDVYIYTYMSFLKEVYEELLEVKQHTEQVGQEMETLREEVQDLQVFLRKAQLEKSF